MCLHLPTARFLTRCSLFCLLWVATNYMYIHSLRILLATDVMALFATNVSCVYLLSWVILHEQFVGVRVSRQQLSHTYIPKFSIVLELISLRYAASRLLGLWVRILPGAWTPVSCECCVLSGRGLCDGPIPHPEEFHRVCVIKCDQVQQ
jgi:hypothetical protein